MSLKILIKLITVLVITSLCIGTVSAVEDYTMWKGDIARSGYTEEIGPLNSSILWETEYLPEVPKGTSRAMYPCVDASPVAADGLVYYAVYGDSTNQVNGIYCADAYTGEERWRYNAATRGGFSLDNGVLYVGTLGGKLIALNALTGELIWTSDSLASYPYVGLSGAPLVVGDTVYITATTKSDSSYSSSIYAFNKINGNEMGYSPVSLQSSNGDGGIGKFASLSSDGTMIYAAGSGGICAFDPWKKQIVWTFDVGARASQSIWVSTPVYSDGKLYLVKTPSSGNSVLYCVDDSGTEIWKISDGNIGSSSPAVTDDKIVVTGKSGLTVYDKSGVMQFHYSTGDTGFASPVVAGNTAYFGTNAAGTLFAVDIVNQRLVWNCTLPIPIGATNYFALIEASPAIYDGNLYVGSENCKMYAFGVNSSPIPTPSTVSKGNISIKSGWNFISIPKTLDASNNTAEKVFAGIDTDNNSILAYNTQIKEWFKLSNNSIVSSLTGYWIYSKTDEIIELNLINESPRQLEPDNVYSGWNAVGLSAQKSAKDAFAMLVDWDAAKEWNLTIGKYNPTIENVNPNYDVLLTPYNGIWLYVE